MIKKVITLQLLTAGLPAIKDKKLLPTFSKNKECFYLPGGKFDAGETSKQALIREIAEELNVQLAETDLEYYTPIAVPAYGETAGIVIEQDCFLLLPEIEPQAAAEID